MPLWYAIDWQRIFAPSEPLLEIVIRGSLIYLFTFSLLRIFRRQTGSIGPADLLVLLLIADAAQNGMADDYRSVTEGAVLISTIIFWEYLIDWLGYRFPVLQPLLSRPPLLLITNGRVQQQNLQRELLTPDELLSHLRQKGIESAAEVRQCYLEGDGHISVIVFERPRSTVDPDDKPASL